MPASRACRACPTTCGCCWPASCRRHEAVDYFVEQCRRELGGLAANLGGLDALVLTGGIGEHATEVRARLLRGMAWLGIDFDRSANLAGAEEISLPRSAVRVLVLATDEERMLAEHAAELTARS